MVVDEEGLVLASNAMALRLFQPRETDPPLNFSAPCERRPRRHHRGRVF